MDHAAMSPKAIASIHNGRRIHPPFCFVDLSLKRAHCTPRRSGRWSSPPCRTERETGEAAEQPEACLLKRFEFPATSESAVAHGRFWLAIAVGIPIIGTHRVAGEVAHPRLPQNVACRFSALRSSEVGSQRRNRA